MVIGAGIFLFSSTTGRLLFTRRADSGAWANFGGTMEDFETTYQCAIREMREESGLIHGVDYRIIGTRPIHVKEKPTITYYSYVGICDGEPSITLNDENIEFGWFDYWSMPTPLHYGVEEVLFSKQIERYANKFKGNT